MGWLQMFFARHGAYPGIAKWACVSYVNHKEKFSQASDAELLEFLIRLRYQTQTASNAVFKQSLIELIPEIRNLSELAMKVFVVENPTLPHLSSDPEWVATLMDTFNRIIKERGLDEVTFN